MHPQGVVAAGVGQVLGRPLVGGAVGVAGLTVVTALVALVAAAVAVVVGIADDVVVVVGGLGELMRAW